MSLASLSTRASNAAACADVLLLLSVLAGQVVMRAGHHVGPDGVARVSGLCLALVTLSQGIPFIHAGDDLLRSKSLDRDSYNSGTRGPDGVGGIRTACAQHKPGSAYAANALNACTLLLMHL